LEKSDKRGIGGESKSSGHVVGVGDGNATHATAANKPRPGGNPTTGGQAAGADGDKDPPKLAMSNDQMAKHVKKKARDKAITTTVFRAFKEEEPELDMNPLLRRRKDLEDAEGRTNKRRRERGGGGGDANGMSMSASNPLRGLFQ